MPDKRERLLATLAELQRQLEQSNDVPEETRSLVQEALQEISSPEWQSDSTAPNQVARGESSTIGERLSNAAQEFEETHPALAGAVGSVVDALSRMGI